MLQPVKYDNGIAVFKKSSIDLYGFPEENNFEGRYMVIEDDDSKDFLPSYNQLVTVDIRKVHRYCRFTRFRILLNRLLGIGSAKSAQYHDCMETLVYDPDFNNAELGDMWAVARTILQKAKKSRYYSFIPTFAQESNIVDIRVIDRNLVFNVICDFLKIHLAFTYLGGLKNRSYFPNLKYMALTLLKLHGYTNPLGISDVKTKAKKTQLDEDFKYLYEKSRSIDDRYIFEHLNRCL